MKRWIFCLAALLGCAASFADDTTFSFAGCADAQGKAIEAKADASLEWIAQARQEEGSPAVIVYNPGIQPDLLPEARLFVFAHECARIALKQPLAAQRSPEQVRAADCWALNTLERSKVLNRQKIEALETELAPESPIWQQVPAPDRELKLASCPRSRNARGNLDLPAEAGEHPDKWNHCVQSCGAKLYSCGRASSCVGTYDACVASCAKK